MKTRKTRNLRITCKNCGHEVLKPCLPDQSYGQFIGSSVNGCHVYVDSFEAETNTFFASFKAYKELANRDDNSRESIVQDAVGKIFLDPDPFGNLFSILGFGDCGRCQSKERRIILVQSGKDQWVEVPYATCERWMLLSDAEKDSAIAREIKGHLRSAIG